MLLRRVVVVAAVVMPGRRQLITAFGIGSKQCYHHRRRMMTMNHHEKRIADGDAGRRRYPKRKVALLLGFRGTEMHGFQRQPQNPEFRTVEGEIQKALKAAGVVAEENIVDLKKVGWTRAARTDKGVSAARQVVTVKLETEDENTEKAIDRINHELPSDIRIFDAVRVTKGFDAKRSCDRRRYVYMLPHCLLMPPDEITEIFARATGRDRARIENFRKQIIAAKLGGSHAADMWRLTDEEKQNLVNEFIAYRATDQAIAQLRAMLKAFIGTKNFHNFTARVRGSDDTALRYMIDLGADDFSLETNNGDRVHWIRVTVLGQSFMLHQIRKMVAAAAHAARTSRCPDDDAARAVVAGLTDPKEDVTLQHAPGEGLYLGEPIFFSYNEFKSNDSIGRHQLKWENDHPKFPIIDAFRRDVVEKSILQDGNPAALLPFVDHLWFVLLFGFRLSPKDRVETCNMDPSDLAALHAAAAAEESSSGGEDEDNSQR